MRSRASQIALAIIKKWDTAPPPAKGRMHKAEGLSLSSVLARTRRPLVIRGVLVILQGDHQGLDNRRPNRNNSDLGNASYPRIDCHNKPICDTIPRIDS